MEEEVLISLSDNSEIVFDEEDGYSQNYRTYLKEAKKQNYKILKSLDLKFYNSDKRGQEDFALDFQSNLLS